MKLNPAPPFSLLAPNAAAETLGRWRREHLFEDSLPQRFALENASKESYALAHEAEDAVIGHCTLLFHDGQATLWLSLWIAPAFRQKGYGTAAGRALLEAAWAAGLERVETTHAMENPAAARLAERLGFLPEGVQRGALKTPAGRIDLAHWGLLSTDR